MAIVGGDLASSQLGPGLRPTHPYYKMNSQPEYVLVKSYLYWYTWITPDHSAATT